jgi:hypothetical protein
MHLVEHGRPDRIYQCGNDLCNLTDFAPSATISERHKNQSSVDGTIVLVIGIFRWHVREQAIGKGVNDVGDGVTGGVAFQSSDQEVAICFLITGKRAFVAGRPAFYFSHHKGDNPGEHSCIRIYRGRRDGVECFQRI